MSQIIILFTTFLLFSQTKCNNSTNDTDSIVQPIDFNFYYTYLTKYSNKTTLGPCFENESQLVSTKNLTEICALKDIKHDASIWNENHIKDYLFSNFLIANLTENVRKQTVESKTNLRRFIKQMDEYTDETKLEIELPQFLRDNINFDNFIECENNEFEKMKLAFYLNYERFDSTEMNSNQLICLIKGNLSFLAVNDSSIEILETNKNKLTKRILKSIKYYDDELKSNECVHVPSGWKYSVKSSFSWFYQISLDNYANCHLKSSQENLTALAVQNLYPLDKDFVSKFKLTVHFTLYLNSSANRELNITEFLKRAQTDKFLLKTKCDYECKNILKKVFYILDSNIDDLFNQDDLDQFDELALVDFNKKLTNMVSKLDKINQKHMENINQFMNDLKNLGVVVGNELSQIIGGEVTELFNELPISKLNRMIKEFDLSNLLGGVFKSSKKPKIENSKSAKKETTNDMFEQKSDESIFENETEIVDEIIADEDDDEDDDDSEINQVDDKDEL